jgi:GAF domain-containing protein
VPQDSSELGEGLAETLAEITRALMVEHSDVQATFERIVEMAKAAIPHCEHAAISQRMGREVHTPAATSDLARAVDQVQYDTGQGPCLDAIRRCHIFESGNLMTEGRWPDFARRVAETTGIRSILCFTLFLTEQNMLGALNILSSRVDAFDDNDRAMGTLFAAHAAVAMAGAMQEAQWATALSTRDIIGQAKGILMARQHVSADEAFGMLRRASQRLNVKLREIAERVAGPGVDSPDKY